MNGMRNIALIFLVGFFCFSTLKEATAQFPRIGKVKLPTKKTTKTSNNSSSSSSSSTTTPANSTTTKSSYQTYMDEGYKQKEANNEIAAYKAFSKALELKSGDYSASNQAKQLKSSIGDNYMERIRTAIKNEKCADAEKDLAIVMDAFGSWSQEKYYKEQIAECKANAKQSANNAASAADMATNKEKTAKIILNNAGKILVNTQFKSADFKTTVNPEEDLFVKFVFGKTITEMAVENGLSPSSNIYSIVKMKVGATEFIAGPFVYDMTTAPVSTSADFVWNVDLSEFKKTLTQYQSQMDISDLASLTNMSRGNTAQKCWLGLLAGEAKAGQKHTVTTSFHLIKDEKSKTIVGKPLAQGTFQLNVTKEGLKTLYTSGKVPESFIPIADEGIKTDVHKKYLNKIAWANKEIAKTQSTEDGFMTSFSSLAKGIYGRMYLPRSMRNFSTMLGRKDCNYALYFYVDGENAGACSINTKDNEDCNTQTSLGITLAPTSSEGKTSQQTETFARAVKNMKEGTHKIKVEVVYEYLDIAIPMASAEFSLNLTKSDKATFVDKFVPKVATGGGATAANRVRITIENKTGKTINYSIMGDGMSGSGSIYNNNTTGCTAPIGYWLKINGRDYHKTSKSDDGKTITVK